MRRRTLLDALLASADHAMCLIRTDGTVVAHNEEFLGLAGEARLPESWPPIGELLERSPVDPVVLGDVEISVERLEHEGSPAALVHARLIGGHDHRFRRLFDSVNDGVLVLRAQRDMLGEVADWVTEHVNDPFVRAVGTERMALFTGTARQRRPGRVGELHPRWVRVLTTGEPYEYTTVVDDRTLLVRTVRIDPERLGVVLLDVTRLIHAERALDESHRRLEQLAATVPGVLFDFENRLDGSGRFSYVSPRARELFELDPQVIVDRPDELLALYTEETRRQLASADSMKLRARDLYSHELELVTPSGKRKWIRYLRRVRDAKDGILRGSGVMIDITLEMEARARLRDALAEAEEGKRLLDTLLEHVPGGIIIHDLPDRARPRLSRDAIEMLGFTPTAAELVDEIVVTTPEGVAIDRSERPLARAISSGEAVRDVELTLTARGRSHTVLLNAIAVRDESGTPRTGIVAWHDITERKRAEAALLEEKERLRVSLRSIGDAVITTDVLGNVTMLNPVAQVLTGWKAEEAVGRPLGEIFKLVDEKTRAPIVNTLTRVLDEGVVVGSAHHTLLVKRDGASLPIADAGAPIKDEAGRISGAIIVFRDQTEERRSELALARSREGLLMVVGNLPLGIFVTRNQRVIYANPSFVELLGHRDAAALIGMSPDDFLVAEGPSTRTDPPPGKVFAGRVWRARRADGRVVVVETAPLRDIEFDGAPAVLWAARDLSELRAIQAQLMQADRLASLGMLAAGIAHEINNPLAFTSASLDYLDEALATITPRLSADERGDIHDLLADARLGATRVRDVVRDLKSFSRTEEELTRPVDVLKLLDSSLQLASTEIRHRSKLVRDYSPVPLVNAHEARLGQVFLNLLVNAAQAIPEGRAQDHEIRVTARTSPLGHAVVEISDSGPGIPPDALDRIFDPFFTTKPIGVGTGIGLAICRSTIVGLGGEIRAVNKPSGGATFIVSLPPAHTSLSKAPVPPPTPSVPSRRGRILVVDDEPTIGAIVRRALQRDHDVTVLDAAPPALELFASGERYDVIICDVMMPEMTGIELYTKVAGEYPDQSARFVFLTGGAFTPKSAEFMEMVPNVRVEKPFDVSRLRSLIAQLVG